MLLNKTVCKCGKDQSDIRFDRYEPNFNKDFYGGRVSMYGYRTCECGRELKGYFTRRDTDQSLTLIDLEVIKDTTDDKKIDYKASSLVIIEDEAPYEAVSLEDMDFKSLKKYAKERGIKGNLKKEEIIKKLREANR